MGPTYSGMEFIHSIMAMFILMKFSSLAALEVVNMTTSSAASDGNFAKWVIKFNGLSWTADSEVHVVHISRVIITYALESSSSLT